MTSSFEMRVGVRYIVTRDSKNREFQRGDRVWMETDGAISCPAANGWMPAEDIEAATEGWAIEVACASGSAKTRRLSSSKNSSEPRSSCSKQALGLEEKPCGAGRRAEMARRITTQNREACAAQPRGKLP